MFQQLNVMGPAHRGAQIAQMAQSAAQNVLQRQKLRKMLQSTLGAHGRGGGAGQPIRGSFVNHAVGAHGGVFRPLAPGAAGQGVRQSLMGAPDPSQLPAFADPGAPDLPSIPDRSDPSQSQASITPPGNPGFIGSGGGFGNMPSPGGTGGGYVAPSPYAPPVGGTIANDPNVGSPGGNLGQALIPLGGQLFYDPTQDQIVGPQGGGTRPGIQGANQ